MPSGRIMVSDGLITPWLSLLRCGNPEGAQRIWDRYFAQLVRLARKKLGGRQLGIADEEDVALSALNSFCRNARAGRFPQLNDSDSLWRLLVVITGRKALRLLRDQGRYKRGGAPGDDAKSVEDQQAVEQIVGNEPTPEFAAQLAEQYDRLLGLLSEDQRPIALAKLEGLTNPQIAKLLNRPLRTVERKLQLIRAIWERAA